MSNTNDRELLELAAKAAGFRRVEYEEDHPEPILWVHDHGEFAHSWSPLGDEYDAMRLAVKLGLLVDMHGLHVRVSFPYEPEHLAVEAKGDDPYAATRRAITRAAAAIGRTAPAGG
jgi:hypothetical protein